MQYELLLAFLLSLIASFIVTKLLLIVLPKIHLIDDQKIFHHPANLHAVALPRGGGIALFIGIWIGVFLFIPKTVESGALFIASLISMGIGVLDDKYNIWPYIRLGINALCVLLILLSGTEIPFITHPLGGILHLELPIVSLLVGGVHVSITWAHVVTVLWVVWVMNMLNWSKGTDGQMPGTVAIAAVVIGILSLRFPYSDPHTQIAALLAFAIAGSALGFLPFNFSPAKIIPGYSATAMYMLLACISFLSSVKLATAILVMGIPFTDGMVTVTRRILSGHSPLRGDKKHLHHLLLARGFTPAQIAFLYWGVSAFLGVSALLLPSTGKLFAIIMVAVIIGGGISYLLYITREKNA